LEGHRTVHTILALKVGVPIAVCLEEAVDHGIQAEEEYHTDDCTVLEGHLEVVGAAAEAPRTADWAAADSKTEGVAESCFYAEGTHSLADSADSCSEVEVRRVIAGVNMRLSEVAPFALGSVEEVEGHSMEHAEAAFLEDC
jgi:hypothetical protein